MAIDKIVEKSKEFPNAKIVFLTHDRCYGLTKNFEEKFQKIKEGKHPHLSKDDSIVNMSTGKIDNWKFVTTKILSTSV